MSNRGGSGPDSGGPGETDVAVLIAGAGPIGMSLALDLGSRGVSCLIIDKVINQSEAIRAHPRAAAVSARTMEFCRRWGLSDAVRNAGFPDDFALNETYCTSLDGYPVYIAQAPSKGDRKPLEFSPENRERCPQIWFDPILESALPNYPSVTLRRGWTLESFEDGGHSVRAVVHDVSTGTESVISCQYLIGCDGTSSGVRRALGIAQSGRGVVSTAVNVILEMPNFLRSHKMGPAERYYFLDDQGTWSFLSVIDGRARWRFTLNSAADRDQAALAAGMRRAFGPDVEYETVAEVEWRRTEAVADSFCQGRVILAGDAAHTMPPDLGMGMNTGVADSVNLGWKLQAMLAGWGGPGLLGSYDVERRPVAAKIARESRLAQEKRNAAAQGHPHLRENSSLGAAARQAVANSLVAMFPAGWDTSGLEFGYQYDPSPVCVPDGTPRPAETADNATYIQTARPGARAPHVWLADGRSTLDLFGDAFVLLRINDPRLDAGDIEAAAAARGVPVRTVDIRSDQAGAVYESPLVLVRPDGHVAWRGPAGPGEKESLDVVDRIRGAAQ
jgi:2-polyprenyl-6-methoxyphenol hydroxylase-like FAD-dependent oxidoreductase